MSQLSLLNILSASKPVPVFGVSALWLCFGQGLAEICERNWEAGIVADVTALAEVSYIYKLSSLGADASRQSTRLECPALAFDQQGKFSEIWPVFIDTASKAAESVMGMTVERPKDMQITSAWRGETRACINNIIAA